MSQNQTNHIDASIADLEALQDQIVSAISTLKYVRSLGGVLPAIGSFAAKAPTASELAHDTFFQMTVPDAAEKYFKIVKATKPTATVAEGLLKGGLKSASKDFTAMVKTIMSRDDRFVKVNKEWGLSEWYPAMRRGRIDKV